MGLEVLVVDDSAIERRRLLAYCAKAGHRAHAVDNGFAALKRLKAQSTLDVLVCDVSMPEMTGLEVLRMARAIAPEVAVLMCTACDDLDSAVLAMRLGAVDYVIKPWNEADLTAALARAGTTAASLRRKARMIAALTEQIQLRNEEHARRVQQNEQLARDLKNLRRLFDRSTSDGLSVVVNLLRRVDPKLLEHARRVSDLAVRVAARLDLPQDQMIGVEVAARLHDVGMVAKEALALTIHAGQGPLSVADEDAVVEASRAAAAALDGLPGVGNAAHCLRVFRRSAGRASGPNGTLGGAILAAVEGFDIHAFMRDDARGPVDGLLYLQQREQTGVDQIIRQALRDVLREFDPSGSGSGATADAAERRDLEVGQRLHEPLRTPGGLVLLPAGTVLTQTLLDRVRRILG